MINDNLLINETLIDLSIFQLAHYSLSNYFAN